MILKFGEYPIANGMHAKVTRLRMCAGEWIYQGAIKSPGMNMWTTQYWKLNGESTSAPGLQDLLLPEDIRPEDVPGNIINFPKPKVRFVIDESACVAPTSN